MNKLSKLTLLCAAFAGMMACSDGKVAKGDYGIIPLPQEVSMINGGSFVLTPSTSIVYPEGNDLLKQAGEFLAAYIKEATGYAPKVVTAKGSKPIHLSIDKSISNPEGYRLTVTPEGIELAGASEAGVFYGIQTLRKSIPAVAEGMNIELPSVTINDYPRFAYRGMHLDVSRHFFTVDSIKKYIDILALHNMNTFHWHLTDDQGWRIEIKKYPELTKIGSQRKQTVIGHNTGEYDGKPYGGFYTQDEIRDVIAYAQERFITIIPEIDLPGHQQAALATYPELGCTHTDTIQKIMGKTVDLMLCANNDKVYTVYDDVIKEIAELFPSSKIHLGGDEAVIEKNWTKCDRCQSLMKQLGYTKESQLMNYFFDKILASVRKYGKEPVLWCELDNIRMPANEYLFDYPKDATLITWRAGLTPKCIELTAKHGNSLIMAPGEYTYLDYPQFKGDLPEFNNWGMPVTTLETCYQFDPGYGLPTAQQAHILGISGTLWGEAIKDINRVTYMTYPRGLALAEAGWTQMEYRNWDSFKERMYPNLMNLMKLGVSIRIPFEIVPR